MSGKHNSVSEIVNDLIPRFLALLGVHIEPHYDRFYVYERLESKTLGVSRVSLSKDHVKRMRELRIRREEIYEFSRIIGYVDAPDKNREQVERILYDSIAHNSLHSVYTK